jgi:hypothetical protein
MKVRGCISKCHTISIPTDTGCDILKYTQVHPPSGGHVAPKHYGNSKYIMTTSHFWPCKNITVRCTLCFFRDTYYKCFAALPLVQPDNHLYGSYYGFTLVPNTDYHLPLTGNL